MSRTSTTPSTRDRAGAVRDRIAYGVYVLGWTAVRRLPEAVAYRLFRVAADVAWRARLPGARRLERTLRQVLGPDVDPGRLSGVVREGMRSYLRYWCDTFRLPDWDADRTVGTVRTIDEHHLREPLAAGRGVVSPLPHMGNWDHAGAWASRTGAPVTTVAERLRPERLFARFVAFRESLGMEVLPLTGGDGDVPAVLAQRLRGGAFVPLLGDRDFGGSGVPVTMFGRTARFPAGPALLAVRTGAALVPVTTWFEGRTLVVRLHEEVPPPATGPLGRRLAEMTQQVADVFEDSVRAHPQDWHMLAPIWDAPPAGVAR